MAARTQRNVYSFENPVYVKPPPTLASRAQAADNQGGKDKAAPPAHRGARPHAQRSRPASPLLRPPAARQSDAARRPAGAAPCTAQRPPDRPIALVRRRQQRGAARRPGKHVCAGGDAADNVRVQRWRAQHLCAVGLRRGGRRREAIQAKGAPGVRRNARGMRLGRPVSGREEDYAAMCRISGLQPCQPAHGQLNCMGTMHVAQGRRVAGVVRPAGRHGDRHVRV
jgi:hypothetical protein